MKTSKIAMFAALVALAFCGTTQAAEWGTITGKFVVDGKLPAAAAISVTKDVEFCGKQGLTDETVVVDAKGGLANVAVWVYISRGKSGPDVHPSYADKAKETLVIDNVKCAYSPHFSMATTGQAVEFKNSDGIAHNFKVEGFSNDSFNTLVPNGAAYQHKFSEEESYPMNAGCSIHPWMNAKILVKESPYMAISAADGTFTIENMPVGEWKFKLWHEKSGNLSNLDGNTKVETDRKGIFEIEVKAGTNDLGVIKVTPEDLE
ncbi:MAG: hypothetical protein COA78_35895 [Blastopirellula sp.]|nr:MAG: hypothetical protein COA78_35895 [Blastopirellula sp.]